MKTINILDHETYHRLVVLAAILSHNNNRGSIRSATAAVETADKVMELLLKGIDNDTKRSKN